MCAAKFDGCSLNGLTCSKFSPRFDLLLCEI